MICPCCRSGAINGTPTFSFLGFVSTSGALTSLRVTAAQPNVALSLLALGPGLIGLRRRRGLAR
jgi:hypothetical protein